MGEAEMSSVLKQTLKNLCRSNGWSYGVFWRFDQRNSMMLTMEDAYYEEQMGPLVDNMLMRFHILGEGLKTEEPVWSITRSLTGQNLVVLKLRIIGQAAFTGKHQWIFSDSTANQEIIQDESQFQNQFSSGIKTIAIISVETWGVVEFGSTQKILERLEFLDETKKLFYAMECFHGLIPLENETCNLDGFFASLASLRNFCNENLTIEPSVCSREAKGRTSSSTNLSEATSVICEIQDQTTNSVQQSLSHLRTQFTTSSAEDQIISTGKISLVNCLAADTPCTSRWSNDGSFFTSFETSFQSERGVWDSPNLRPKMANVPVCANMEQNFQGSSSFYSTGELVDTELPTVDSFGKTAENQSSFGTDGGLLDCVINQQRILEEFNPSDFTTDLSNSFTLDDLSQWFAPSPQHNINGGGATRTTDLSCSVGVTPGSSSPVGGDTVTDIPVRQTANSLQNSITDTFMSNVEQSTIVNDDGNDLFNGVGLDFRSGKTGECLKDIIMPLLHDNNSAVSSGMSESISELDVRSTSGKRKGLFSELGLEEILHGVSNSAHVIKSSVENQFSTSKRTKTESSSSFHQGQFMGLSCSGGNMSLVRHSNNWDQINDSIFGKDVHQKSQVGLWIDDSYSVNAGQAAVAASKKPTRKRAKPGESTRPRPKDRQLIQDRIKELRGIIPHSGKQLSIDLLLERTIKHLLFLQGVTKYSDKIKQADEPQLIGQENGMLPKHDKMSGGATWAFEVGPQTIPIVVKDLNPPGQMLIEMLCEDRGFFLEIADVIRGFGLNILKGVMEHQEDKIWARFTVEAKEKVERTDIIWSLLLLLQQTGTNGIDSTNQPNAVDGGIPLSNNLQQPLLISPVNMAETLR